MTELNWRGLCEELADWIERSTRHYIQDPEVLIRAREALAQPKPEVVEPTDEELRKLAAAEMDNAPNWEEPEYSYEAGDPFPYEAPGVAWVNYARAVLARWGRPAPVPAEGEVAKLVAWLRDRAAGNERFGAPTASAQLIRAADLLEQRHPAPVPVSERLPGPEDCDENGDCWFDTGTDVGWMLCDKVFGLRYGSRWWLPATALPLPSGEVEE